MNRRFELELKPEWDAIKASWDRCQEFFKEAGLTSDEAYALSMAAQELLENAVKYGDTEGTKSILLRLEVGAESVTVEVLGPAPKDPKRLKSLDDTIQWIRGFQNPFEAYVERLK